MKILVVDDCKAICDVTAMLLRERGLDVDIAYDAAVAYELMLQKRYDVVLTDYYTERGSGGSIPSIARTAKQVNPRVRVIITSGFGIDPSCLAGCDVVCKPFHVDAIVALMEKWGPAARGEVEAEEESKSAFSLSLLPIPA
ncbi:MAG TPA: response regulator [Opitutaceae bacterium]|jgi:DNA-binding NtrC family response regulator|nr:response regulator [Opitutaceae bacterium]